MSNSAAPTAVRPAWLTSFPDGRGPVCRAEPGSPLLLGQQAQHPVAHSLIAWRPRTPCGFATRAESALADAALAVRLPAVEAPRLPRRHDDGQRPRKGRPRRR